MSSIVAGLFLVHLAPTGAFNFATTAAVDSNVVIKLCAFQIVPELFLDFYVTFMEIFGGLKHMHVSYWKLSTGSKKDSKKWGERRGDIIKSLVMKVCATWGFTAFVLAVCVA
jgi:hypothetical protein